MRDFAKSAEMKKFLPEVFCIFCHKKIAYKNKISTLNKEFRSLELCCKNKHYSLSAAKREKKFKETIEENGFSKKHNLCNRKEYIEKLSNSLKSAISNGKFTPNVTNSWAHSKVEINAQNKNMKFRSSWEAIFWLANQELEYEKIRISYNDVENIKRNYIVDFCDVKNKILYEIKPKSMEKVANNKLKHIAAVKWCKENEFIFKLINEKDMLKCIDVIKNSNLINVVESNKKLKRAFEIFLKMNRG
jgi:hypothetical protein